MKAVQNLKASLPLLLLLAALTLTSLKSVLEKFSFAENFDLKNVKHLKADIKFNAGELIITAHNQSNATFRSTYSRKNWKPEVNLDQKTGTLTIHQPEERNINMKDEDTNEWGIKLPKSLATDLKLRMGAGEGTVDLNGSKLNKIEVDAGAGKFMINLANTSISSLDVNAGVGSLSIDLSGKQENNLNAKINGGIGEVKLILPSQSGVRVKVNGLGSIDRNDLKKQDGYYVNDLYGKTSKNVEVTVNGGLGSLELTLK